jgi:hypothetical protein
MSAEEKEADQQRPVEGTSGQAWFGNFQSGEQAKRPLAFRHLRW